MSNHRTALDLSEQIEWSKLPETEAHPGDECSICIVEIEGQKMSHNECSLMVHKDCLVTWLAENSTCPLCRRLLKPPIVSFRQGVQHMIESRRESLRRITQHYVVSQRSDVRRILESLIPAVEFARLDFWNALGDIERNTSLIRQIQRAELVTHRPEELIRRKEEYNLNQKSMSELWCSSRIVGVTTFQLLQFEQYPNFGFWMPNLPEFIIRDSPDDLIAEIHETESFVHQGARERMHRNATNVQVPVPARVFAEFVRSSKRMQHEDPQTEIQEIYRLEREQGVTHWALHNTDAHQMLPSHFAFDTYRLAVPWPSTRISWGYTNAQFPGLDPNTNLNEWESAEDQLQQNELISAWRNDFDLNYDTDSFNYYGQSPVVHQWEDYHDHDHNERLDEGLEARFNALLRAAWHGGGGHHPTG